MGSKNLKAIAVRGKKKMEVADEESVKGGKKIASDGEQWSSSFYVVSETRYPGRHLLCSINKRNVLTAGV
jgi:aldehyde:ferredoxin oxidoreductase